jgi:hypothetical protein
VIPKLPALIDAFQARHGLTDQQILKHFGLSDWSIDLARSVHWKALSHERKQQIRVALCRAPEVAA